MILCLPLSVRINSFVPCNLLIIGNKLPTFGLSSVKKTCSNSDTLFGGLMKSFRSIFIPVIILSSQLSFGAKVCSISSDSSWLVAASVSIDSKQVLKNATIGAAIERVKSLDCELHVDGSGWSCSGAQAALPAVAAELERRVQLKQSELERCQQTLTHRNQFTAPADK